VFLLDTLGMAEQQEVQDTQGVQGMRWLLLLRVLLFVQVLFVLVLALKDFLPSLPYKVKIKKAS